MKLFNSDCMNKALPQMGTGSRTFVACCLPTEVTDEHAVKE